MVTVINESKTLSRHISCKCKCKFHGIEFNSNHWWNNDKYRFWCKRHHICETYNWENGKYLASIIDRIICDKITDSHNEKTHFHKKKAICKTHNFCILLSLLLITITLLIAVSIYCYLIKYQRKHLLPFHDTTKFYIDSINWKWVM